MNRAAEILDRIESDEPYPVEDRSDLAGDREQISDLWLDTIATRRLAVDYLAGVRDLLSGGIHCYAPFALVRAVLESAATAIWLVESDERSTRLKRLVGLHIDDTNKKSVQFMVPEQYRDPFDHQPGIKSMVQQSGSPRGKCKFPDYTAVLKTIDDLPGEWASMLLAWRVCSGFSHGLTWATTGLISQSNRVQVGPASTDSRAFPTTNWWPRWSEQLFAQSNSRTVSSRCDAQRGRTTSRSSSHATRAAVGSFRSTNCTSLRAA